jgi:hypothetical protein
MSIRRVVPDIICNRIHERRKFYTEVLGFDVAMDMDCDPHGVVINVMSHK